MKLTGIALHSAVLQALQINPQADSSQVSALIQKNAPPETTFELGEVQLHMSRIAESQKFLHGLAQKQQPTPTMQTVTMSQSPAFMVHTKPIPKSDVQSNGWSTDEALRNALTLVFSGGKSATVKRGIEGDITLHPPSPHAKSVDLGLLAGTHQSCAKTFSDSTHTVEDTARQLISDPSSINSLPPVTVFWATSPSDPSGTPKLWSMNNRRIKAMQIAQRELAKSGKSLPKIPIVWAKPEDVTYAIGPGKFNNGGHGEVAFTESSDNQQRVMRHLATNNSGATTTQQQISKLEKAMKKGEEIDYAAMFNL